MGLLEISRDLINVNLNKPYEIRMQLAIEYWLNESGMIQSDRVCKLFSVNHKEFTLYVQQKIAKDTGINIKNTEPKVFVINTKEELNRRYPKNEFGAIPYGLDFFDFIFQNKYEQMREMQDLYFSKKDLDLIS
jgi:hypothetical protein